MVTFRPLNLIEDPYPLASSGTNFMDIILCRNVMIYFRQSLNTAITRRFYRSLNNGGYLIVGHAEYNDSIYGGFQKELHPHTVVYRKVEPGSDLDRGIPLRFRGTGQLAGNVVPTRPVARAVNLKPVAPAPAPERLEPRKETVLFEEGVAAFNQGQTRTALLKFREVLDGNPRNHRACYMLGLLEANQNHLRKAEEYCRQAISAFPLSLEANYLLAVIAREEGDLARELEYLKKTIYIHQDFILGHFQLGIYYQKEGNNPLARKFLRNALKLLDKWDETDYIEGTDGMTVGRLRSTILKAMAEIGEQQPSLLAE
jgi:chemotaxis protein methyltransferase CheR